MEALGTSPKTKKDVKQKQEDMEDLMDIDPYY